MIWYLVMWTAISCPGWIFKGMIPGFAKPMLCSSSAEWAIETRPERALQRARDAGCSAKVVKCKQLKCQELKGSCGMILEGL